MIRKRIATHLVLSAAIAWLPTALPAPEAAPNDTEGQLTIDLSVSVEVPLPEANLKNEPKQMPQRIEGPIQVEMASTSKIVSFTVSFKTVDGTYGEALWVGVRTMKERLPAECTFDEWIEQEPEKQIGIFKASSMPKLAPKVRQIQLPYDEARRSVVVGWYEDTASGERRKYYIPIVEMVEN